MDGKKKNPYTLIWYKEGWSQNKININNANYWDWERKYNGFIPPNSGLVNTVKIKKNKETMTQETKDLLIEAYNYCEKNDKSTEFMLQYMQDFANVDLDVVLDFIDKIWNK